MRSSRSDYATQTITTAPSIVRIKNTLSEDFEGDYSSSQLPKDSWLVQLQYGIQKISIAIEHASIVKSNAKFVIVIVQSKVVNFNSSID